MPRAARAIARRKISSRIKRPPLVIEEDRHRPAALAAEELHRLHVDRINIRPLLAIDLHADEALVEQARDLFVFERLLLHHVAPVAGRVADGEEDRHVALARFGEGLVAPGAPIDRIVRVLKQVGALLEREPVRVLCTRSFVEVAGPRRLFAGGRGGSQLRRKLARGKRARRDREKLPIEWCCLVPYSTTPAESNSELKTLSQLKRLAPLADWKRSMPQGDPPMESQVAAKAADSFDVDEKIFTLTRSKRISVPPYPAVALKLHELTSRERFNLSDVVDVVSADQALMATVLRAANSALFSAMGAATTLQQAVARLGASEVSRLALAAGLAETMRVPGALQGMRRQAWAEGVASAQVSHALARLRGLSQQDAFTCGLLHDFGKLVGIACLEQVLTANPEIAARSEESWKKSLARVVPELGALIATTWNLPPLLHQAISLRTPQTRQKSHYAPLLEVIALSDEVVARMMSQGHVDAADLQSIKGLKLTELDPIAEMLPRVPVAISAFENDAPPEPAVEKRLPPTTTLGSEPLRPLKLPVDRAAARTLRAVHHARDQRRGLDDGGRAFPAGAPDVRGGDHAASAPQCAGCREATPAAANGPLRFWASTTLCMSESGAYRIECKPFALDRDGKRRWADLLQSARG